MVIAILLKSCSISDTTRKIENKVNSLEASVQANKPSFKIEDGNTFYEINGQRAYLFINGKSASLYDTNTISFERD